MESLALRCPSREKDDTKEEGAKWDSVNRVWTVPPTYHDNMERFNRGIPNGRYNLDCPYHQKDEAKTKGVRFDYNLKKSYFIPNVITQEERFSKGLPKLDVNPAQYSSSTSSMLSSCPKKNQAEIEAECVFTTPTKTIPVDNENVSSLNSEFNIGTLPCINDDMATNELQEQNKHDHAIKSQPATNEEFFLGHLKVGSVWGKQACEIKNALYILENNCDTPKKRRKKNNEVESSTNKKKVKRKCSISITVSTFNLDLCQ